VKTSDKRGPIVLGILKVVQGGVVMLGLRLIPDVTGLVPVVALLGGGVTNTSDTLLPSSSAIGLDGGVWKDLKLWSFDSGLILVFHKNRVKKCCCSGL
jgi:hypothetical protein